MTHKGRHLLSLFLILAFILPLVGCATTPAARWAQARQTLTTAQNTILESHRAGLVSDKDLVALDPFVKAVRGALDRAAAELPAGGSAFDFYMNLATDALTNLSQKKVAALEHPAAQPRAP